MSRPAFHMPRTVTRAVHLALFGLTITPLAMVPNQVIAQTEIAQSQVATYSIAAGPLGTVLSEFATAAGVTLSFAAQQTQGINSQGLQGTYSVDQGLSQLLTGSALKAQLQSNGSYVLVKSSVKAKPLSETLELGAIEVSATSFGATTEGTGLYTTSSTATATGLNLSLRETPQSVTVITRQRMDDQALNSLGMVLDQTPGVSHSSGTDYVGYTYTYSRGYRIANFDVDGIPGTGGMSVGGLARWVV